MGKTCNKCGLPYMSGGYTFTEDGEQFSLCRQCKNDRRKEKLNAQYRKRSGFNDIRNEIVDARGERCEWCKKQGPVEAHHIISLSLGGTHDEENIVLLCHECHRQIAHNGDTRNRG